MCGAISAVLGALALAACAIPAAGALSPALQSLANQTFGVGASNLTVSFPAVGQAMVSWAVNLSSPVAVSLQCGAGSSLTIQNANVDASPMAVFVGLVQGQNCTARAAGMSLSFIVPYTYEILGNNVSWSTTTMDGRPPCPSDLVVVGSSAQNTSVLVTEGVVVQSLEIQPGSEIVIMPNAAINILTPDEAISAIGYLDSQSFHTCDPVFAVTTSTASTSPPSSTVGVTSTATSPSGTGLSSSTPASTATSTSSTSKPTTAATATSTSGATTTATGSTSGSTAATPTSTSTRTTTPAGSTAAATTISTTQGASGSSDSGSGGAAVFAGAAAGASCS
eukprot:m.71237 g.71237  ORF g.71237 m.71237 type:complete len:336 (+) comp7627_c0_seq3:1-1008(+)